MPTWRELIIGTAVVSGVTCTGALLALWWGAYASGTWKVTVEFNYYREAWLEGVMLHVFALAVVLGVWRYFGR